MCSCLEIAVPNFYNFRKNCILLQTISCFSLLYLLFCSLSIVNELNPAPKPHFWVLVSNGTAKVETFSEPPKKFFIFF